MVHGGGFHHSGGGGHHAGGNGWSNNNHGGGNGWNNRGWGNNSSGTLNSNSTLRASNNSAHGWWGRSYQGGYVPARMAHDERDEDECEECCACCPDQRHAIRDEECEACCQATCMCCVVAGIVQQLRSGSVACPFIFLAILVFVVLTAVTDSSDSFTLNVGETRQVQVKAFDEDLQFGCNIPQAMTLYVIEGACPPLVGPKVRLHGKEDIKLARRDFQYDYFYLNQGSLLNVTLVQDYGATNLVVVKGLGTIDNMGGEDDDGFASQTLIKRYAGPGQSAHIQYSIDKPDTYVVVYDNAANSNSRAKVNYRVDITTFNLTGVQPISTDWCDTGCRCTIPDANRGHCILLKADNEITVHISVSREWGSIILYSAIPLIIGIIIIVKRKRRESQAANNSDAFQYPPATAPLQASVGQAYAEATFISEAYAIPVASPSPSAPLDRT